MCRFVTHLNRICRAIAVAYQGHNSRSDNVARHMAHANDTAPIFHSIRGQKIKGSSGFEAATSPGEDSVEFTKFQILCRPSLFAFSVSSLLLFTPFTSIRHGILPGDQPISM